MGRIIAAFVCVMAMASMAAAQPAPADEQTQFDAAFEAMLRGDFAAASAGFKALASTSATPERRASSNDLARLADELMARGGRLSYGPPSIEPAAPGAVVAGPAALGPSQGVVAVSEDDSRDGGRASFVITTTMASFYSGFVLLDLLDVDDLKVGTLVVMGSTAGGVLGSLYGTSGRTMTGGMADAWRLGLFAGVGNALLLSAPIGLYDATDNASEKVNSFVLASGWGLATAGLLIADNVRPTRGQVTVVENFGLMGVSSTLLSLAIIQPEDIDGDAFLTVTALGLDAGLAVGALFGDKLDWSHSRARLVELSAFLGGVAGVGTSILLLSDSDGSDNSLRAGAAITLAGLWGGFFVGSHLTRNMVPDYRFRNQGAAAMIGPTSIRNAPGLALTGTF
jgi:hypothetical protein